MKFVPASIAACSARIDSSSSTGPQVPPMAQAPKLMAETFMSVRPSGLYSMAPSAEPVPAPTADSSLGYPRRPSHR